MRVLFDTNVVLDVLLARQPFEPVATALLSQVEERRLEGLLCATTFTTVDYLLHKALPRAQARTAIQTLLHLFQVATVDQAVLQAAADSSFGDFEDAVLHFAGKYAGVTALVTRNVQDFAHAEYPIYTPSELWALLTLPS